MAETAESIERTVATQGWIDQVADPVQRALHPIIHRSPSVAYVLHGDFLQHPLHAALTDVPVGAWFTAQVLDFVEVFGGSRRLRRGADAAHAVGLAGAMLAAVAGMADWSTTRGEARRVGFVHAATNTVIAGLYGASLLARRRHRRGLGIALSSAGYGLLIFSSWLGGELSYRYGVGQRERPREGARPGLPERGAEQRSFVETIEGAEGRP